MHDLMEKETEGGDKLRNGIGGMVVVRDGLAGKGCWFNDDHSRFGFVLKLRSKKR